MGFAEGVIPAVITPFNEQEELNEPVLRAMIQRFIAAGVDGLFCLGTNAEFYTLTEAEKIRIVQIIAEENAGRLPLYAGAGSPSTRETIRLISQLKDAGATAISLITPYFISLSEAELIRFYEDAAHSTSLPIMMYNIPARTGNALTPAAVAHLSKVTNIVGIKDSSGSFDTIINYLAHAQSDFSVLAGNDGLILATLMAGGKGTVTAMANILPETVVAIYQHWKVGRYEEAEEEQRLLRVARSALRLGSQPAALKSFMNEIGLSAGKPRLPVQDLSEAEKVELRHIVEKYQMLKSSR